jgi:hypothetical protein
MQRHCGLKSLLLERNKNETVVSKAIVAVQSEVIVSQQ